MVGASATPHGFDAHTHGYAAYPSTQIIPEAPAWFWTAPQADRVGSVVVRGATVRFLEWGRDEGPCTVLIHGGGAHAQWWAPLARLIEPDRRVVAMDFSGHGLSDRRRAYDIETWIDEVRTVCTATSEGPATVVAHSFGGIISTLAATRCGSEFFSRLVAVDAPVWPGTPEPPEVMPSQGRGGARTYAHLPTALSRFRLVPPQPCENAWYVRHIAFHGLREIEDGWRWRFDPKVFANPASDRRMARFEGDLTDVGCPMAVVLGGRSYLAGSARHALATGSLRLPRRFVPSAGHHVMLDQPLDLVEQIRSLLDQDLLEDRR